MRRRRGGARRALFLAVTVALLLLVAVGVARADLVDRVLHPRRYAVSGSGLLPADLYVEAARGALGHGERVAALAFPDGVGPVTVTIVGQRERRTVYLDPPSARLLAVAAAGGADGSAEPPLARPAQSVARVIVRARPIGDGEVARVDWPTTRNPDWTVRFAGRAGRRIKVADDSGSARPVLAREQDVAASAAGWLIVACGVLAVIGTASLTRSKRRSKRAPMR